MVGPLPCAELQDPNAGRRKTRLTAGVPAGDPLVFQALVAELEPPYFVLYVLHTPRGEGEPGRYQSPALTRDKFLAFMSRYAVFLSGDGRHDIWAHSPSEKATIVWDRHNLVYAYGPLARFDAALRGMSFEQGEPNAAFVHQHHYRREFDSDAAAILGEFNWSRTPLQPSDEQFPEHPE